MPKSPTRPTQYPSPQWARELQRGKPRHSCRGGRPGVKSHDGVPFSSADVTYTIERIMHPPPGMVSPRGPLFNALIERVEAPDPETVVVYGKGPSPLLLPLFANGHNVIIPKHIAEKDPVSALKTTVIGTGPFRLKEPPTSSLWKYERNPDYFKKDLPYLDEMEIHIITDAQSMMAAVLSKRVYWSDSFAHPTLLLFAISLQTEKPPLDDLRVRQALSEAIRREAINEMGSLSGVVGTGNYPPGFWAMPTERRAQHI